MEKRAGNILYDLRRMKKTASMENSDRNISNSLKHASSMNFSHAIIVGEKELKENSITVKNLNSGEQKMLSLNNLSEL